MVDWRSTASRVRNSISSRAEALANRNEPPTTSGQRRLDRSNHQGDFMQSRAPQPSLATGSVQSIDATSTGSSMSRVPGAFYIPTTDAQRASVYMRPEEGAALRRQLAFDALALVRELPCSVDGYMLVKRDMSRISTLFRSQWMQFWAELRGGMILFCDPHTNTDYSQQQQERQIKHVVPATNCLVDVRHTPSYSQLKLHRPDGQCVVLRMATAQDAQQWAIAVQTQTFQYTTIRLADFDWITAIGKGASGKVFLVRDNRTNARLALKVIDKSRVFRSQLTFQHVINERLVLEMCSGCPFLIQMRYSFQTDSHLYFATDFYDGGDVFSLLQSNGSRLSEPYAKRIIAEIILALSWLHERNIVYRDLKPENVVLDGDGHVRLADFGLAKVLKSDHDYLTQTICGTTAYAAPEMLQSKPYNVSLDLWCLGIFIYHVLSGRPPFNFKKRSMVEMEQMQRNRTIHYSPSLSLEAVSLIKGLLQNDPFRRSSLEDVKRHPFFRGVDWVRVMHREPHPDGISPFVSDRDQRESAVARLAVARAQQLGMESESTTSLARADVQEISSMTLDRYLLRNINPEEWRHVSFSDDDDASASAEFPPFVHRRGSGMETWAIAGWAWTCSEASGLGSMGRHGRRDYGGLGDTGGGASGRRSLPSLKNPFRDQQYGRRPPAEDQVHPHFAQRPSVHGNIGGLSPQGQRHERVRRGIHGSESHRLDFNATAERPLRHSADVRHPVRSSADAPGAREIPVTSRKTGGRGMLKLGRRLTPSRSGKGRASLDGVLGRSRRSMEGIGREDRKVRNEEFYRMPGRNSSRRHVRSSMETPFRKDRIRSSFDFGRTESDST
ncbi:unnamed protein product [Chondrus crispus]|uniref:Serine/threonine protein kinase n=1 Tax=Chondrus crispus TaxID=2769 RepID=R7QAL8_CHOCR|nr:unnamed protein product [Chondrus crispus]CDF35547.1 unnamed protein product [Chondrus crispus]|eukprot:XP_005715366.1 unnamed protein product [Chondrus crispus]